MAFGVLDLEEEIRRQRALDALSFTTPPAGDDPSIPKPVEEHYGDWKNWDTLEIPTPTPESPSGAVNLQTDEEGQRYAEDDGKLIPHAELATPREKEEFKPSDVILPQQTVEATPPAPDKLDQVERGELVGLPYHPAKPPVQPAPDKQVRVEPGELVLPVQKAPPVTPPDVAFPNAKEAPQPITIGQPTTAKEVPPAVVQQQSKPDDWKTWITADGTVAEPQAVQAVQPSESVGTLKAGEGNRVDPTQLYSYLVGKFSNSGLVGYVPPDGARWGIETGSPAEWAAFGLSVAKQESDLNTKSYNASDPGGSVGLFQFGQGQTQFTKGGNQFDPQESADAFVRSVEHYVSGGNVANLGATFGSIRRPNEAGQYIPYAQEVASRASVQGEAATSPQKQDWESWETLSPTGAIEAKDKAVAGASFQKLADKYKDKDYSNLGVVYKDVDSNKDIPLQIRENFKAGLQKQMVDQMIQYDGDLQKLADTGPEGRAKAEDLAWKKWHNAKGEIIAPSGMSVNPNAVDGLNADSVKDLWSKVQGVHGQFAAALRGDAIENERDVMRRFFQYSGADTDQKKQEILTKIHSMTPGQQFDYIKDLLPKDTGVINIPDPTEISRATDRLSNDVWMGIHKDEHAKALEDAQIKLAGDPRMKATFGGNVNGAVATIANMAEAGALGPASSFGFFVQAADQEHAKVKAEHPEWNDAQINQVAWKGAAIQAFGQELGMKIFGGLLDPLTGGIAGGVQRRVANSIASALGMGGVSASASALTDAAEGKDVDWRAALEAGQQGALAGGIGGLAHGVPGKAPEVKAPEAVPEIPPAVHGPAEPPPGMYQPVNVEQNVPEPAPVKGAKWFDPNPIVTRGTERTTFTPAELAEQVAGLTGRTPEEIQAAAEKIQPPMDFGRREVFLNSDEAQNFEISKAQAAQAAQPTPVHQAAVDRTNVVRGATGDAQVGAAEPWVSKVANRFTAERMASGELGHVDPSIGVTKEEMLARGLKMKPEEINQHVSDVMSNRKGDPKAQASALRAEEARLAQRSHDLSLISEADSTNEQKRLAAQNAFDDVTDFHKGPMAKLKSDWHAQGMSLQGEIPVDLSTYNGLREAYLRDVGKPLPPGAEKTMRKVAKSVRDASAAETAALNKLGAEIERQSAKRNLPTADQVREEMMKIMKVDPCPN